MSLLNVTFDPDGPGLTGHIAPLIGIGLPPNLALHFGGKRPVMSVLPQDIPHAGLNRVANALIVCQILGDEADALDILAGLARAGYRGRVLVITPPLPDPAMVERELAQVAQGMTISLMVT